MKDTDKVTLTLSQIKRLIKESKAGFHPMDLYDSIMEDAGLFIRVSQFRPKLLELVFEKAIVYWKTNNPSPGDLIAIDDGKTIYFNILDKYDGEDEQEILDAAVQNLKKLMGPSDLFDQIDSGKKKIGVINM